MMDSRNCGYCRPCGNGRYDECTTFPGRPNATSKKPFHPQADYVLDLLVAAGHITRERAFQARDIAVKFGPDAAPGAPGQEAAAVQASPVIAYATVNEEGDPAMLFFDKQEAMGYCEDDDEPIPLADARGQAVGAWCACGYPMPCASKVPVQFCKAPSALPAGAGGETL